MVWWICQLIWVKSGPQSEIQRNTNSTSLSSSLEHFAQTDKIIKQILESKFYLARKPNYYTWQLLFSDPFSAKCCSVCQIFWPPAVIMVQVQQMLTWQMMSLLEKRTIIRYLGVLYLFLSWTTRRLRAKKSVLPSVRHRNRELLTERQP